MSASQLLLRRLLDQAGGASETGYLLVIDGEGLEDLPNQISTPKGAYGVHRVTTELGLRHLLWKAKGAPLIAVMPEAVALRIQNVSRPAEFHRWALAEPYVKVSSHTAPIMQPLAEASLPSAQIVLAVASLFVAARETLCVSCASAFCTSSSPML